MLLPYKTAPKPPTKTIGAADIGTLEFPVYYGLTVAEKQYIEEHTKDLPDIQAELINLADRIATENEDLGLDTATIANRLSNGLNRIPELQSLVAIKYRAEYDQLQKNSEKRNEGDRAAYVSALLIHRLGVEDWQPEYIHDPDVIRDPLVSEIFTFAIREEGNYRDPKELDGEAVGKSDEATTESPSTGAASSGSANTTGPTTTDSAPTTSAASPSG